MKTKYYGHAINGVTGQTAKTIGYNNYQAAHLAAEKLGKKKFVAGSYRISVTDKNGSTEI